MNEKNLFEEIVSIRRDIHQHPEIEFDVDRTAAIAANQLRDSGVTVREKIGISGVVGDIHVKGATKRIALRADMDALPMEEQRDIPYRSKNPGKAHMCGHDAHTAMLIGAAKILSHREDELKCHVRFIFQPCEEKLPGGAPGMIEEGALDDVDEIYALHVWPTLAVGKIGLNRGAAMAQPDIFEIKIKGVGGHAGAPQTTVDPIVIGAQMVTALQTLVSRQLAPSDSAVISVTQFHAGSANNVIPPEATLTGTVRTYSQSIQYMIKRGIHQISENLTAMYGATFEINYQEGYPILMNDLYAEKYVVSTAKEFLDEKDIHYPGEKVMFGEDFAYYTQKIPGCFVQLGCRNEEKDCIYPLHHPCFNLDEDCMKIGVKLLTSLCGVV
jgi:amidohydrolase